MAPDQRNAASQFANGIDVALEIGENIFARGIVQTFFASQARGAKSEDTSLHRPAAMQTIVMTDFKEARITLAVIEIPFERRGRGYEAGGTKHTGFLRKRVGQAGGRDVRRTEQSVALFGYVRDGENFAIAETDEPFAQARFGFVVRKASGTLARGG